MTSTGALALATRGLRKSYGTRVALDGLDLSVPSGVVYGFLGPSGAGKTTTMRLLTGCSTRTQARSSCLARPSGVPDTALLPVAVWLVGALLVSAVFTDRAEITG